MIERWELSMTAGEYFFSIEKLFLLGGEVVALEEYPVVQEAPCILSRSRCFWRISYTYNYHLIDSGVCYDADLRLALIGSSKAKAKVKASRITVPVGWTLSDGASGPPLPWPITAPIRCLGQKIKNIIRDLRMMHWPVWRAASMADRNTIPAYSIKSRSCSYQ